MKLSIVIPAHNEAADLENSVASFVRALPNDVADVLSEIIIVENGSTDGTWDACRRLELRFPKLIRAVTIPRGSYGEAIKKGMMESRGTHLSILECDFLYPQFVSASISIFRANGASFVVGSKRLPQSIDRRPLKRRLLTALYNLFFLRLCIGYPGTDTHGLKSIEAPLAKKLCELALTTDEVFQTEIVLLAWRLGVKIEEVPLQIQEMRCPTVSVIRRLPKVTSTVQDLRRSLARFPKNSPDLAKLLAGTSSVLSGR
jgi:GT2 family glycosyltransferase